LIKTLVCHGQPLQLVGKNPVTTIAQHANIELIQQCRIRVHVEEWPLRVQPEAEWRLCARRRVGPSGLLCLAGRRFGVRSEGAAGDERRKGTRSRLGGGACGPNRSCGQIRSHGGRVDLRKLIVESEVWKDFSLGGVILPLRSSSCLWANVDLQQNTDIYGHSRVDEISQG
jgi:hypothetical protein